MNGAIVQYLHALDVATLAEKFAGPVRIQAAVPGTGSDASGGLVSFNARQENQRAALALSNGHVVISWGAHCDKDPWHGWVMSYSASTLAQEAAFNTSPNSSANGVWMSGAAPAVDASGNIYLVTGNGNWNGSTDYGDSIVKLAPPANGAFTVLDYFTPYDQATLEAQDNDLGAGGLVLLPPLASGQQLLAQQGKAGMIVLLDAGNLGQYCINLTPACTNSDPQIVQELQGASTGIWGSPAYWNGNLYWTGANDHIKAYSFNANNSGLISTKPTSQSAQIFAFSAPTPTVSANGATNGIVWAMHGSADDSTCGGGGAACMGLYAYDATNLTNLLYTSMQAPNNRDSPGTAVKFEKPIVANGKVYVGTQGWVSAYGLLTNALPTAAVPTFTVAPGTYSTTQSVAIAAATPGVSIYYTTNGTMPTVSPSELYSGGAISVSSSVTINAVAVASGYSSSPVTSGTYVINTGTGTVVSLSASANVDAIVNNGSAVPNGGLDGSRDAYSATLLSLPLTWNGNTYFLGGPNVADAVSNTTVPLPAGSYAALSLLGTAVHGNQTNQVFTINYTDGTSSSFTQSVSDWATPQNYAGESRVLAMPNRVSPSGVVDPRIFYLYGYSFALNPAKTVASLTLPKSRNVIVLAIDLTASGSPPPPTAAAPTLSPSPGTYSSAQSVAITDATPGASIYYTTDGTAPTVNPSELYASPIAVSSSMTINAMAVANGYTSSPIAGATYLINTGTTPAVPLIASANVDAIVNNGSAVPSGGLDGSGNAYSATLLGTSLTWNGNTYSFGSANIADAVSNTTVPLPAGSYATLSLLGTAVKGNQPSQVFTVNYTDGTSSSFTQSVSDWFAPQNYGGESRALAMPYRLLPSGTPDNRTFYLYGYSFALNPAKTVASLTLPKTRNIIVLAIDLTATGSPPPPTAAAPTLTPSPGTYSSAQSVAITAATPGASIYYTTDGTTPTVNPSELYASPVAVSASMTINAIAVASGYTSSPIASATYLINTSTGTAASVPLIASANVDAIVNNGSAVLNGGLDGSGNAYSATLLGPSLTWNGNSYSLGSANIADAVSNTTVPLPAGSYATLSLLATAVQGNQPNQVFTVNYSDGTSSSFTQSVSDWYTAQNYAGESAVLTMPYRLLRNGALDNRTFYLYGYSFALNPAKTVASLTLPTTRKVIVVAVDLQ